MATNYNNKIVTDGLEFCVDFADRKSYSGSGSTVYDRGGGSHNGSALSAPTYTSDFGGAVVLDGSDDGFQFNTVPQIFAGSVSFDGWFYFEDSGARDVLFGSYNTSGFLVNFEKHTSNNLRLWWNGGVNNIYSSNNVTPIDEWCYIVMIRNKEAGKFQFYVNGEIVNNTTVSSADGATAATPFRLGRDSRTGTTVLNGKIGCTRLYSKALTAAEVLQNFNAQRGRFGI